MGNAGAPRTSYVHGGARRDVNVRCPLDLVMSVMQVSMARANALNLERSEERRPRSRRSVGFSYVAMTRVKDDLHLVVPQRFFTHQQRAQGDSHVYASRTRFVPNSILHLFAVGTWLVASEQAAARVPGQGVRVDLSSRMRGMWRRGIIDIRPIPVHEG
jgi:hypothetical protein